MRYSGIIKNDFAAAPGVCLTVFVQGCPIRCKGCHNPESWDFDGGREFTEETLENIKQSLLANGIQRTLCIMGGEPLCEENLPLTLLLVILKFEIDNLKIWIWTGYEKEDIFNRPNLKGLLNHITGIVTGPYIEELRDITLPMRGSSNQEIVELSEYE